jgi:hypothetical protein
MVFNSAFKGLIGITRTVTFHILCGTKQVVVGMGVRGSVMQWKAITTLLILSPVFQKLKIEYPSVKKNLTLLKYDLPVKE